jgi:hypothetical protein
MSGGIDPYEKLAADNRAAKTNAAADGDRSKSGLWQHEVLTPERPRPVPRRVWF